MARATFAAILLFLFWGWWSIAEANFFLQGSSPLIQHVVIVMEENTDYSAINSTNTPNMAAFASSYGLLTNFWANTHPSIGNYFVQTTGQALTNNDNDNPTGPSPFPYTGDNIISHLNAASKTWKAYVESIPSSCYFGGDSGNYTAHHNPLAYFQVVQSGCGSGAGAKVVEFFDSTAGFSHDLTAGTLPNFSYVVPNNNDNGHSGSLSQMDSWVQTNVIAPLKANSAWSTTLLLIVFDESGIPPASSGIDDDTWGGGHIWAAVGGGQTKTGYQSTTFFQQQSIYRGMLEALGLPYNIAAVGPAPGMSEFSVPSQLDEFVGPFSNWANAKTTYSAAGNGSTDDTTALQSCLTSSSTTTCFIPAGNYKISSQLNMTGLLYANVIGADPATTCIFWAGSAGGTMLRLNGTALSKISRLTLNGSNSSTCANAAASAAIAIDQSWDGTTGNSDNTNEYSDLVLKRTTSIGFQCGALGNQCSEISMLRDTFSSVVNGISMGNGNALDVWCWYCQFLNLSRGMTNNVSGATAGNGSVFGSIFQNSSVADLDFGNTEVATYSWNYSTGSATFRNGGGGGNPDNIVMQGNYVATTGDTAVSMANWGPLVLLDNTFKSPGTATPVISVTSTGNIFSQGNSYTTGSVGSCGTTISGSGHCHSDASAISSPSGASSGDAGDWISFRGNSTIVGIAPTLPGTPPNNSRAITEVSTAGAIQSGINTACAGASRSVAHIQAGSYSVGSTLTVPANCAAQIIGDGIGRTVLTWSGGASGTLLQLAGPSKAVVRDLEIHGAGNAQGIDIKGADQIGASIWGQGLEIDSSTTADWFSDSLDYATIELHDTQFAANVSTVPVGLSAKGGTLAAGGNWQGGSTNIFSGAAFGHTNIFQITANGHLSARQIFTDAGGPTSTNTANESGTGGALSLAAIVDYANTSGAESVVLNNFTGTSAILELDNNQNGATTLGNGRETISGTGTGANNLNLANVAPVNPLNHTGSGDTNGLLNGFIYPTGQQTESGTSTHAFLKTTLAQLRTTAPVIPLGTARGVTDVRLARILVLQGNPYGVHVEH